MVFCSNCGTNLGNEPDVRFCSQCGTPVVGSAPAPSAPVQSHSSSSSGGSNPVSNRYLPGTLGTGGDIDSNLSRMLGIEGGGGPQPTQYTVETRIRRQQAGCSSCGIVTPNLFEDEGKPFCEKCLATSGRADTCKGCGKAILDGVIKKVKENKYHPDCLRCNVCSSVISGAFAIREGKMICKSCAGVK